MTASLRPLDQYGPGPDSGHSSGAVKHDRDCCLCGVGTANGSGEPTGTGWWMTEGRGGGRREDEKQKEEAQG